MVGAVIPLVKVREREVRRLVDESLVGNPVIRVDAAPWGYGPVNIFG